MRRFAIASALVAALVSITAARADDIADAIAEAKTAYEGANLAAAKKALELANTMVAQKQAEMLGALLPEPPAGWTAKAADSNAVVNAMFGGGITVERTYMKGDKSVVVNLMADSPLLGIMGPAFANVQTLGGMGKVFRQKGRTAVISSENEIQIILGKTFVTLSGSASEAEKREILNALDLDVVETFGK